MIAVKHPGDVRNIVDESAIVFICFTQRPLRCFGLGDIAYNSGDTDDLTLLVLDGTKCQRYFNQPAIIAVTLRLEPNLSFTCQDAPKRSVVLFHSFWRNNGGCYRFS